MTMKWRNITGWVLSGVAGLMLGASAIDKIVKSGHALEMGASFGLSAEIYSLLGIIEILSVALFLYKITGILGTLLLSSYLGGAIATHLQHQQDVLFPAFFEALIWVTAVIRFPELTGRLYNKQII